MSKVVASPTPQPPDGPLSDPALIPTVPAWIKKIVPDDPLAGPALVPYAQALRILGVSRPTLESWLDAGVLPRPVRPLPAKGRLYFRREELIAALKAL